MSENNKGVKDADKMLDDFFDDFDEEVSDESLEKQEPEEEKPKPNVPKKTTKKPTAKKPTKKPVKPPSKIDTKKVDQPLSKKKEESTAMTTQNAEITFKGLTELSPKSIVDLLCPKADATDIAKFMYFCKEKQLNPFLNECYLIKYYGPDKSASIVTAKDIFLKRAETLGTYRGIQAGIIVEKGGKETIREGARIKEGEELVGSWAKVYRADRDFPFYSEVGMEYLKESSNTWKDLPATMLRKVALVQSLREAFPDVFSGMYDQAEFEGRVKKND